MPVTFTKPLFFVCWILIPVVWLMIRQIGFKNRAIKDQPRWIRLIIIALRTLLVLILGLTLADPRMLKSTDRVNLFFCLDVSESVGRDSENAATAFMKNTTAGIGKEDVAGLIVFGKQPSLEISLKNDFVPRTIRSQVDTHFSNIYAALQLAIGKLPQAGKSRIVLFTDGNQNLQDASEIAYLAASLGIEIYPVPLSSWFEENEVFIKNIETPEMTPLETPFEIRLVIISAEASNAELILFKNDNLLTNRPVKLRAGKNVLRFKDTITEQGFYLYRAVLNSTKDAVFQNNEGLAFTRGTKKSAVLYITSEATPNNPLIQTLDNQGIEIVQKPVEELPHSIHGFLEYRAIIFDNAPAQFFSFRDMENIETYVRDIGGGLVMIGGDKSFGAGNYADTPVEKALPVLMDIPSTLEFPGFCLILVIDRSSSMEASLVGKNKLEGAKIAAFSSIEMLNPTDKAGILAFDTNFKWIVPITLAGQRQKIAQKLSMLDAGGGTDLYPALVEAYKVLKDIPSAKKHIIVLSDGLTEDADFPALVNSMREEYISLSTVALGSGADRELMTALAQLGGGRAYYTGDVNEVPRIFVGETKIAARDVVVEKPITPQAVIRDEMLSGIPIENLPALRGLVMTHPKQSAQVLFDTEDGPLLAAWQYGLGRSAAFTSDLSGRWGKEWVQWAYYGKFVSQMIKWAQRKETPQTFTAHIARKGEQGTFTVEVTDEHERFVNHLNLKLKVLTPSKTDADIVLEQVAPGTYQENFPTTEIGEYYLNLLHTNEEGASFSQIFGYGIPYTDEFKNRGVNKALLEQIATLTRSKVLDLEDIPANLFTAPADTKEYGRRLWPYLTIAFVLLLLVDVAVRKISTIIPGRTKASI